MTDDLWAVGCGLGAGGALALRAQAALALALRGGALARSLLCVFCCRLSTANACALLRALGSDGDGISQLITFIILPSDCGSH